MNARWLLLLLFCSFQIKTSFAQKIIPYKFTENDKQWEDGPLTWEDFQGKPLQQSFMGSDFSYTVAFNPEKLKWSDTTLYRIRAITFLNKDKSWVLPASKNANQLMYNQVLLNALEVHERLLQMKLNRLPFWGSAQAVTREAMEEMEANLFQIQKATQNGQDEAAIAEWQKLTQQVLDSLPAEKMPRFRDSNFGMGLQYGIGHAVPGGKLGNLFSGHTGGGMGFDFKYRNFSLYLDGLITGGHLDKPLEDTYQWPNKQKTSLFIGNITVGYPIINNRKWRIAPFAGPGVVEFSPRTDDQEFNKQTLTDGTLVYGVNADFKLRKQVNMIPMGFGRESADYGFRTRFSVYPINYSRNLTGVFYSLSLSFYFNVHFVKLLN